VALAVAKAATRMIPIVFGNGDQPVSFGLVATLSRPGGNLTGVTMLYDEVAPKRLEVMHALFPTARQISHYSPIQAILITSPSRTTCAQLHLFPRSQASPIQMD
jgi:putative ABC transport system substrate-binding protein